MGTDISMVCIECNDVLYNVARNTRLNRSATSLAELEAFLFKHADHHLCFPADDNWNRMKPGWSVFSLSKQMLAQAEADVLSGRSCSQAQAKGSGACGACIACLRARVQHLVKSLLHIARHWPDDPEAGQFAIRAAENPPSAYPPLEE